MYTFHEKAYIILYTGMSCIHACRSRLNHIIMIFISTLQLVYNNSHERSLTTSRYIAFLLDSTKTRSSVQMYHIYTHCKHVQLHDFYYNVQQLLYTLNDFRKYNFAYLIKYGLSISKTPQSSPAITIISSQERLCICNDRIL